MADEVKTQFKLIKVLVINEEKLSKEIDKEIKREAKKAGKSKFAPVVRKNEFFTVRKFAIATSKSGKRFITDNECIHDEVVKDKIEIDVYSETRDDDGKRLSFGIFPRFTNEMTIDELLKKKYIKEVSMFDFMKGRFQYNPRIENNMRIFVKSMVK